MKYLPLLLFFSIAHGSTTPIVTEKFFEEKNGGILVEAEHFHKQEKTTKQAWYITTAKSTPKVASDQDEPHIKGSGRDAYVEALSHQPQSPNTAKAQIKAPGETAILSYRIKFTKTGRYYCWARGFNHSNRTANGIHLGLNGTWPESGKDIHWATRKINWSWNFKQSDSSDPLKQSLAYITIDQPGIHTIQFSMREEGSEFDRFVLHQVKPTEGELRPSFLEKRPPKIVKKTPPKKTTKPPVEKKKTPTKVAKTSKKKKAKPPAKKKSSIPKHRHISVPAIKGRHNSVEDDGSYLIFSKNFPVGKAYRTVDYRFISLNTKSTYSADTSVTFPYFKREYYITLHYLSESHCASQHQILINGQTVLTVDNPIQKKGGKRYLSKKTSKKVKIKKGDTVTVKTQILDSKKLGTLSGHWQMLRFKRN